MLAPAVINSDFKDVKKVLNSSFNLLCEASGFPVPKLRLKREAENFGVSM